MNKFQLFSILLSILFLTNLFFFFSQKESQSETDTHRESHVLPKDNTHVDESDEHKDTDLKSVVVFDPPSISVVIPLYNQLKYLQDAVDSIFAQDYSDWEIIIVDDGSTEWSTRSFLENLKQKHPGKVEIIYQTNGGLSAARNAGIKQARGKWVIPLDADDVLDHSFMRKAMKLVKQDENTNLVVSDLMGFDADDPTEVLYQWKVPNWDSNELLNKNLLHCCPLYKRDLWEVAEGYSSFMLFGWEDWEFWLRVNERVEIVPKTIHEDLFKYRLKPGMHSFCADYHDLCFAMIQSALPHMYSTEEVLRAHQTITANKKLIQQPINNQLAKFCDTVALHLWSGLIKESNGQVGEALLDYEQARRLASGADWQPMFRIAMAKRNKGTIEGVRESKEIMDELMDHVPSLRGAVAKVYGSAAVGDEQQNVNKS